MNINTFNSMQLTSKVEYLWDQGETVFSKIVNFNRKYAVMVFKVEGFYASMIHNRDSKEYISSEAFQECPKILTLDGHDVEIESWEED